MAIGQHEPVLPVCHVQPSFGGMVAIPLDSNQTSPGNRGNHPEMWVQVDEKTMGES
jgi:hypothetical protein